MRKLGDRLTTGQCSAVGVIDGIAAVIGSNGVRRTVGDQRRGGAGRSTINEVYCSARTTHSDSKAIRVESRAASWNRPAANGSREVYGLAVLRGIEGTGNGRADGTDECNFVNVPACAGAAVE